MILARDPADSTITIDNRGSIAFAGRHGIRAVNPAGQSIDIVNTRRHHLDGDSEFRAGIYAWTEAYGPATASTQTATASAPTTHSAR